MSFLKLLYLKMRRGLEARGFLWNSVNYSDITLHQPFRGSFGWRKFPSQMVIRLSETIRRQKFKWYLYFQNIFEMTSNPGKQLVAVAASFRVNTSGLFETPGKIWFLNSLGPFAGAQPHTRRGGGTPGRRDPGYWVSRLGIMVIYTVYFFL